jgi:hypothetical protein
MRSVDGCRGHYVRWWEHKCLACSSVWLNVGIECSGTINDARTHCYVITSVIPLMYTVLSVATHSCSGYWRLLLGSLHDHISCMLL